MSIQNAEVVKDNTLSSEYQAESEERGSPRLTVRGHILSEILKNARRWRNGYQSPESKAKKFGSVYDCLLLTPMHWPKLYAVLPEDAPKRPSSRQRDAKKPSPATLEAIDWWDDFLAEHPGEVIDQKVNAAVHGAIAALRKDEMIAELIDHSKHQVWLKAEWKDGPTGLVVPIKALVDVVPSSQHPLFGESLWDVKTTMNAGQRSFAGDAYKYGYHRAAALYLDLWNAAMGENRIQFGHIIQENFPPFELRTPPPYLSQRAVMLGRLEYEMALGVYCRALQTGEWPSYDRKSKEWPITEFPDWCYSVDNVFDDIEEDTEPEAEEETEPDLTP